MWPLNCVCGSQASKTFFGLVLGSGNLSITWHKLAITPYVLIFVDALRMLLSLVHGRRFRWR